MSETVSWTFQINDVVFVSRARASTYSLYFECGYFDCLDWQSWHPFKIALKYLKKKLRRPFENCEFTLLLYMITYFLPLIILNSYYNEMVPATTGIWEMSVYIFYLFILGTRWRLFQKCVVRTKNDICFYYYHWIDTSAGGLLVPEGIISLGRYLCWWTISPRGYHITGSIPLLVDY